MIDIDENEVELRRRRQEAGPEALFEAGMVMGHLVAFRRDLFNELGGFDPRLSSVQDYHFALRAALHDTFAIGADLLTVDSVERDAAGVAWRVLCRR